MKLLHKIETSFYVTIILALGVTATDTITILQKGKTFSEKKVTIKTGDQLRFLNDDTVAHNVYSIVAGKKLDLGLQRPGDEGVLSFDQSGRYRVRCAIHPKMKLTVTVE